MMNVFSTKQSTPKFKFAHTIMHTYPGYPGHLIKEKVWKYKNGMELHRVYLYDINGNHKEFVGDIMTDEEALIRAGSENVYLCDSLGHIYLTYNIRRKL